MKKILFIIALLTGLTIMPVDAKTTPVQSLQDFSIANPSQTLLIKILSNVQLSKDLMLHEGYYVLGQIMNVSKLQHLFLCLLSIKISTMKFIKLTAITLQNSWK